MIEDGFDIGCWRAIPVKRWYDRFGSFSDALRKSLSVRNVPFAEVNPGILNGSFGE